MVLKMKTQNLQQQKRYAIDSKTSGAYSEDDPIKFLTKSIESSGFYYSDTYFRHGKYYFRR